MISRSWVANAPGAQYEPGMAAGELGQRPAQLGRQRLGAVVGESLRTGPGSGNDAGRGGTQGGQVQAATASVARPEPPRTRRRGAVLEDATSTPPGTSSRRSATAG